MMGKLAKCIDLMAAVFLMFLFPAVCIHIRMRDRLFDMCVARVREYGEMMQKQGYLSMDAARYLLETNMESGAGILCAVEITLLQERGGESRPLTMKTVGENDCSYMGVDVYPFSCGDGLLFTIRMPADGFEQAYYYFCGAVPKREYSCYFSVRDGLAERMLWGDGEEGTGVGQNRAGE
ncbi:MAG: hypothetical protein K2N63_07500 [Lachnospiraceae bacterium]|nr:hypothetical protein [Lachnospiraceae bacterium]